MRYKSSADTPHTPPRDPKKKTRKIVQRKGRGNTRLHIRGRAHDFIQDDAEEAPVSCFRISVYAAGEIDERADL